MSAAGARRQRGFSLVELMVSVAIGLFLLAMISGVYLASSRVFTTTGATTSMDENARTAFEWLGGSTRVAGFGGCVRLSGTISGDTRSGTLSNWWQNFAQPVQGKTLSATDSSFSGSLAGTDVLMLIGVDMDKEAHVVSDNAGSATITTGAHGFQPGQTLMATSCQLNSFFVMSGPANPGNNATTIQHATPDNCSTAIGTACAVVGAASAVATPYALPSGAQILPTVANAYFIANSATTGKGRSLWNTTTEGQTSGVVSRELINGVENMKLYFGLDSNGDGAIDSYAAAASVSDWSQVIAVKVHLLLATQPDAGAVSTGANSYSFDGQTVTPAAGDKRIFREYTAVFSLRNKTS